MTLFTPKATLFFEINFPETSLQLKGHSFNTLVFYTYILANAHKFLIDIQEGSCWQLVKSQTELLVCILQDE